MDAIIDWIAGAFVATAAVFGGTDVSTGYQGYVEADYVRVAVPEPGTLELLAVRRGDRVRAGDLLFALDDTAERAARDEAAARLAQVEALDADLRKGERPEEIAALAAERRQAQASLALTKSELDRQQKLFDTKVIAESRLDEARSAYRRDVARVAELDAQIATAELGGRTDAIAAAAAEIEAARAALAQAEWHLSQRSAAAAMAALVDDTLYAQGEHVGAGKPVVSLLAPGNLFVRFFVPETELGRIAVGQRFTVICDGCAGPIAVRVSFVSPDAEYTPPVIYSEARREKLVFMIEARPLDAAPDLGAVLHPGQPVTVTPDATAPGS